MAISGLGMIQQKLNEGTDLEKFVELYSGFGIECKVNEQEGSSADKILKVIVLESLELAILTDSKRKWSYSEKIKGGYTKIVFSGEGKFIEQGIWE